MIALIFTLFRAYQSQGQLKITSTGFFWKKTGAGAGKTVELPIKGVLGLHQLACSVQQLFCAECVVQCANVPRMPYNVLRLQQNADIDKFIWTKVARGCQLGVKGKSGATTNFTGCRDQVQTHQQRCFSIVCRFGFVVHEIFTLLLTGPGATA